MDQDLPIDFPLGARRRNIPQINTDNMYMDYGPDSTQIVRVMGHGPDQNRTVRQVSSQIDCAALSIEEFDTKVRGAPAAHSAQRRFQLNCGRY